MSAESIFDQIVIDLQDTALAEDKAWLVLNGVLVFFMQTGFSLLEIGSSRIHNSGSVLLKNFGDTLIVSIIFTVSYGFAFGTSRGGFIGGDGFFITDDKFAFWFFQSTFASTSATIVSGCLLERITYTSYYIVSALLSFIVYPIVAHWVWNEDGYLYKFGSIDFAGGGVVHLLGGTAGLVGTLILGPRANLIDQKTKRLKKRLGHSVVYQGLGTLILWFGWYGFNCGSTLALSGGNGSIASLVAVNTTLAASAGGLSSALFKMLTQANLDFSSLMNGVLTGLVASTSGCASWEPWAALLVGAISGIAYQLSDEFLLANGIDDPVSAVSVHAVGGVISLLGVGLLASTNGQKGLFYGNGDLFAAEILEILAIVIWTGVLSFMVFFTLNRLGILRVSKEDESKGIDVKIGVASYPELDGIIHDLGNVTEFDMILENPFHGKLWSLHMFLELEFSSETLDYILVSRAFKEYAKTAVQEDALEMFKRIAEIYIAENGEKSLNIRTNTREQILREAEDNKVNLTSTALEVAEQDLYGVLRGGAFRRFSAEYEQRKDISLEVLKVTVEQMKTDNKQSLGSISKHTLFVESIYLARMMEARSEPNHPMYTIGKNATISWTDANTMSKSLKRISSFRFF